MCGKRFRNQRREKSHDDLWFAYVFHKQTIRELSESTGHDRKTLELYLEAIVVPKKLHTPRPIHLVVDATYFGKRREGTGWGVVLFRDADQKENLWWKYVQEENMTHYREGKETLEGLGYTILSVTCDGFSGNIPVFQGIPAPDVPLPHEDDRHSCDNTEAEDRSRASIACTCAHAHVLNEGRIHRATSSLPRPLRTVP